MVLKETENGRAAFKLAKCFRKVPRNTCIELLIVLLLPLVLKMGNRQVVQGEGR
jgi:hypothetical protein